MQSIKDEFNAFTKANPLLSKLQTTIDFSTQLFYKEHFHDAAIYAKNAINLIKKHNHPITAAHYLYFAQCFYASNDIKNTLQCTLALLQLEPENINLLTEAGLYTFLLSDLDKAQQYFLKSYQLDPNNYRACDGLAHLYGIQNNIEKMRIFGNTALGLKDKEAFSDQNINNLTKLIGKQYKINSKAPEFNSEQPNKNIISFSLWGDKTEYIEGAILNATLAPIIYPEWKCRFYCDTSVATNVIDKLRSLGSEVRVLDKNNLPFFGLFWRFFVAEDPAVDRFIIRDCDCIINCQERVAVDEWVASGKHFHIMRDYASHTELIHAGMWGGVRGAIPKTSELIVDYYDHHPKERTIDQRFLRHYIWPIAKQSKLCHDSHYSFDNSTKFNSLGHLPTDVNIGISWQTFFEKACK